MKPSDALINAFMKRLRDPAYHVDLNLGEAVITIDDKNKVIKLEMPKK